MSIEQPTFDVQRANVQHPRRLPLSVLKRCLLLMGLDLVAVNSALFLALQLEHNLGWGLIIRYFPCFLLVSILCVVLACVFDAYDLRVAGRMSTAASALSKAGLFIIIACLPILHLTSALSSRHAGVVSFPLLVIVLLLAGRGFYVLVLIQLFFQRRVLIIGAGWAGRSIVQTIKEHDPDCTIVGYIYDDEGKQGQIIEGVPVLGKWIDLITLVQTHDISDIVLATTHDIHDNLMRAVLRCFEQGVRIVPMPELFERITGRIPVEHIGERWLTSLPIGRNSKGLYPLVKLAIDITIASIGLLVLAPFFPFLALAIKLDSPGPIFYRAERLGQGRRPFRLWKFRTMVLDADRIGNPTFTKEGDCRITRVGRILRAAHLDELPQFLNILKGEMSAIGPRPERYVPELQETIPFYYTRYAVKPGMTGWAFVNQGYAEGIEETFGKLQYDLYYIKHQSLFLDIVILIMTAIDMIRSQGR